MTKKDYLEKHIPHRINLLITYRERFSKLTSDKRELIRDFHRCSKDISMLMVRFLLGELGVNLREGNEDISEKKQLGKYAKRLYICTVIQEPIYNDILEVLKAANRAVAHMEEKDVNHSIVTDLDDKILFNAITYTEEKIKTHIYSTKNEYDIAMNISDNNMHRERLKL